jgi:hypothetical protein
LFSEMIALKEKDHSELHAALLQLGEKPDDSGSFMATIHKTIIYSGAGCHYWITVDAFIFCNGRRRSV